LHLALNNIAFPGNMAFLYSYMFNIASFDFLPTDDFYEWLFEF